MLRHPFLQIVLCLMAGAPPVSAQSLHPADAVPFVYFGHVFLADTTLPAVRRVGAVSAAAPAVAVDPSGRIWGRFDKTGLAALDPADGRVVMKVALPRTPYRLIITPSGKAYVTHAALTKDLFTLSVVDTRAGKLLKEIKGIDGLCTGLATAGEAVYLAAVGAEKGSAGALRLYKIDTRTDELRELKALHSPGHTWRIAAAGDRLYVGKIAAHGSTAPTTLEVWDRGSHGVTRTVDGKFWGAGKQLAGLFADEAGVCLILVSGNAHEIVLTDAEVSAVSRRLALSGPAAAILARRGNLVLYFDRLFETGHRDVSLRYVDAATGKEVKSFLIPDRLPRGGPASVR